MKKIKGLLLFGILTLLGIGSFSFASTFDYSYCIKDGKTYPCYGYSIDNNSDGVKQISYGPLYLGNKLGVTNTWITSIGVNRYKSNSISYAITRFTFFDGGFLYGLTNHSNFSDIWYSYFTGNSNISFPSINSQFRFAVINLNTLNYIGFPTTNTNLTEIGYRFTGNNIHTGYDILLNSLGYTGNFDTIFYGGNVGFSAIFHNSLFPYNKFVTFLDDGLIFDDSGNFIGYNSNSVYEDVLVVPLRDYDSLEFTGNYTVVLKDNGISILYNLYDCFSNRSSVLMNCNLISKGYLLNRSDFLNITNFSLSNTTFLNMLSSSFYYSGYNAFSELFYNSTGNYNGGFKFVNYGYNYTDTSSYFTDSNKTFLYNYRYKDFDFVQDNSVETIITFNDYPSYGMFGVNSLYYHCLVEENSGNNIYCYNPDGSLRSEEELRSCYFTESTDVNLDQYTEFFCIDNNGFIQNISVQSQGSGSVLVPCVDSSCQYYGVFGSLNGYSSGFFDDYLNNTGYFFKCPWPYDNKLTIWPKLISLLNGLDILVPINCGIAGFSNGKNVFTFENSGHFVPNGPLLNFEGENRTLLYYFFDVLISIGIVIFVGKIFYLFHK